MTAAPSRKANPADPNEVDLELDGAHVVLRNCGRSEGQFQTRLLAYARELGIPQSMPLGRLAVYQAIQSANFNALRLGIECLAATSSDAILKAFDDLPFQDTLRPVQRALTLALTRIDIEAPEPGPEPEPDDEAKKKATVIPPAVKRRGRKRSILTSG